MDSKHPTAGLGLVLTIGLVLGVGMMFGIAGCPTSQPGPGPADECTTNDDCPEGQVCQNGDCVTPEPEPCEADEDCPEGQVCENGECITPEPEPCETDEDCPEGQVCEDGECVEPEPAACEADEECDDGEFCNGTETCVEGECQAGTAPCTADQVCDEETDACDPAPAGEAFAESNVLFDDFERVHGLHQDSAAVNCTDCHHDAPVPAGFVSCFDCHSDNPAEFNSLKSVAHDSDGDDNGCRSCHNQTTEEGSWDCSFCHTAPFE